MDTVLAQGQSLGARYLRLTKPLAEPLPVKWVIWHQRLGGGLCGGTHGPLWEMMPCWRGGMVPTTGALADGPARMLSTSQCSTLITWKQPGPLVAAAGAAAAAANTAHRHKVVSRPIAHPRCCGEQPKPRVRGIKLELYVFKRFHAGVAWLSAKR